LQTVTAACRKIREAKLRAPETASGYIRETKLRARKISRVYIHESQMQGIVLAFGDIHKSYQGGIGVLGGDIDEKGIYDGSGRAYTCYSQSAGQSQKKLFHHVSTDDHGSILQARPGKKQQKDGRAMRLSERRYKNARGTYIV
jgi:hypothetical protein